VLTLVLRFAHVFGGALWVGMMAFQVFFLMPALGEVGPDGGKVMGALARRRIQVIMPLLALIVLVSGMWLFQRMSGGNMATLMATPMGKAFALGGAIALIAFVGGMIVMRPAVGRNSEASGSRDGVGEGRNCDALVNTRIDGGGALPLKI
jgi:uncharacterized membrane protein